MNTQRGDAVKKLTATQREWLAQIGQHRHGPVNWAGCPYSVFAALIRKGLVAHRPRVAGHFSQWDTFAITKAGRDALQGEDDADREYSELRDDDAHLVHLDRGRGGR